MHRSRLLKMAELMDQVATGQRIKGLLIEFDLRNWGDVNHPCGTHACAIGTAIVSGQFREEGFEKDSTYAYDLIPTYENNIGWNAVTEFFEIGLAEAYMLFESGSYDNPTGTIAAKEVAERIRTLLGVEDVLSDRVLADIAERMQEE